MTQIRDVRGYCPVGCGKSLHLTGDGSIVCLSRDCPEPDAAQKILLDSETEHIALFEEETFTIQHPLRDRLGDLFSCTVHTLVSALPGPPEGKTGKYRVRVADGDLILESLG